jgi:hypothetical protein
MHILESTENLFNGSTYVVTNSSNRFQQEHNRLAIYERINMQEKS